MSSSQNSETYLPSHRPMQFSEKDVPISPPNASRQPSPCRYWTPFVGTLFLVSFCSGALYLHPRHHHWGIYSPDPARTGLATPNSSVPDLAATNTFDAVDAPVLDLFARQSRTLEQATARYTLRTGREPPLNYEKWFRFAQEGQCLIDEYDRIRRDFEPFYQIARDHPEYFPKMLEKGRKLLLDGSRGITTMRVQDSEVQLPDYLGSVFDTDLQEIIQDFAHILPEMEIMANGHEEPRVVFDVSRPDARQCDAPPGRRPLPYSPRVDLQVFRKANEVGDVAFLASSSSSEFTTDLWPLLSSAKISPCFSDILLPSTYHYSKSWWSTKFEHEDDIPWEDKAPVAYWRGSSNGGQISGDNFRAFPRFRLLNLARARSDLIDARMTEFTRSQCKEDCDADAIVAEYNITVDQGAAPPENAFKYRYVVDMDGNSFSGRFLPLLRSGSLVFKSTAFEEYFSDWLRPYEHYVPVRPDLADLEEKILWARANDAEARRIQARGMYFANRVMTDRQNDCYSALVLLEWARLANYTAAIQTTETSEVASPIRSPKPKTRFAKDES
ncbi:CAP10 domain-containing protein [Mycena kentingensis (nom. inval.)]|nr:CAP10 domain-containing protein [Mycena kentingensis (nom. inval.)]